MSYYLKLPPGAYHVITALEHCAWPNLTLLPDGAIGAVIFNQPSHGAVEGDVELWVSADGGYTWGLRSQVTHHVPPSVRMNVAAGLNPAGELVVLCSGWSLDGQGTRPIGAVLDPWVLVSADGGHTWQLTSELTWQEGMAGLHGDRRLIPFGDVCLNGDECLVSCYAVMAPDGASGPNDALLLRSADGGRTWGDASVIGADNYNETALLVPRSNGAWLALSRLHKLHTDEPDVIFGGSVRLFRSTDQGRTWLPGPHLSQPSQHPGHLLQLADGRILATYGSRIPGLRGVCARISEDGGETWGPPQVVLGGLLEGDCGYPASVEVEPGEIVTAYYANCAPWHRRYHMGVVRWRVDALL